MAKEYKYHIVKFKTQSDKILDLSDSIHKMAMGSRQNPEHLPSRIAMPIASAEEGKAATAEYKAANIALFKEFASTVSRNNRAAVRKKATGEKRSRAPITTPELKAALMAAERGGGYDILLKDDGYSVSCAGNVIYLPTSRTTASKVFKRALLQDEYLIKRDNELSLEKSRFRDFSYAFAHERILFFTAAIVKSILDKMKDTANTKGGVRMAFSFINWGKDSAALKALQSEETLRDFFSNAAERLIGKRRAALESGKAGVIAQERGLRDYDAIALCLCKGGEDIDIHLRHAIIFDRARKIIEEAAEPLLFGAAIIPAMVELGYIRSDKQNLVSDIIVVYRALYLALESDTPATLQAIANRAHYIYNQE